MSSSHNHYDQHLLGAAPEATKEQRQEGYNIDLLKQSRTHHVGTSSPPNLTPRSTDVESALPRPKEYNGVVVGKPVASHTSFFRSTKGRIVMLIIVIIIIGAVVGGAVGGTVGKHKNNTAVKPSSGTSTSTSISSGAARTAGGGTAGTMSAGTQNTAARAAVSPTATQGISRRSAKRR